MFQALPGEEGEVLIVAGTGGATEEADMDTNRIVPEEGLYFVRSPQVHFSLTDYQKQRSRFLIDGPA